jgi:hypothetical protein
VAEAEKDLQMESRESLSVDNVIRKIISNWLLKGRVFKLCLDAETDNYFMLSEVEPENVVKTLISNISDNYSVRFLSFIKPIEKRDSIYIYKLQTILKNIL